MRKQERPKGPSQRSLRIGELIRKELAACFSRGEVVDPELDGITITVPEVRMSPDLKVATVYVMPLGGERREGLTKALARNARFLRGYLAPRIEIKFMPQLRFQLDETFDEASRIDALLRSPQVARDLGHGGENEG